MQRGQPHDIAPRGLDVAGNTLLHAPLAGAETVDRPAQRRVREQLQGRLLHRLRCGNRPTIPRDERFEGGGLSQQVRGAIHVTGERRHAGELRRGLRRRGGHRLQHGIRELACAREVFQLHEQPDFGRGES